uniref:TonB-dependent receptor, plug n=1 Tax=Solibacter usitatus (strain Ellin6076) TaxID=234267 RepID=Q026X1_SOLUE
MTFSTAFRAAALCGLAFLCARTSLGQTSTSQISGTAFDHSGAVIVDAIVTCLNEATGTVLKQTTNSTGLYAFPSIPVGSYTLTVESPGFKKAQQAGNKVVVGTPLTINFNLELGSSTELVNVEATVEQLNTTNATLGNVVERQAVQTLPLNGRNPLNLIVLEPGVTQRSGTTINVNGMRGQAGNVTIDGIEANEASNPTPTNNVFRINPDNVEEFKVTTSNPSPEEGKNSGLNVSIATRSGSNEFHGSLVEYFRNNDLNTNEFYANAQGQKRANLKSNQYGFEVSGPIRKGRTFFYGAWQGQKVSLSQAIDKAFGRVPKVYTKEALSGVFRYFVADPSNPLTLNGAKITQNSPALVTTGGALANGIRACGSPTDLNCVQSYNIFTNDPAHIGGDPAVLKLLNSYPAANTFSSGDGLNVAGYLWNAPSSVRGPRDLLRIDHMFNANNNVFFRVMWATEQQLQGDLLNGRPAIFPGFPPRGEVYRPASNWALSWRRVITPRVVNELTAGFARFTFLFTYGDSNPQFPNNIPAYTFNNVDVDYIFSPHSVRVLNTPQLIDNISWTRGAHVLKFGANVRLYQQNDGSGSVSGINVLPAISLSASLNAPGAGFNLPGVAAGSAAGISSVDNTSLLSAVNDLLGIPATLKQGFLGNLNTNTFSPLFSGNYLSIWAPGERARQFNAYAQDEFHVRRNLTLTYGVRWEYNQPHTEVSESPYVPDRAVNGSEGPVTFVKSNSWWKRSNANAFAPRLGLSWSPDSRAKTVVHAGYGLAFDSIPTYSSAAAANSVPGLSYSCTATTYGVAPTKGCGTVPSNTRLSQNFPQQLTVPAVQPSSFLTPPAALLGTAPNIVVFDPNFKTATVQQWNLTIQHELPGGLVLQTGYVGNRGQRLYSQTDINQIGSGPILPSFTAMQSNLAKGCKPDGSGCAGGVPVPLVTNGILTSAFVNSSTTITDLQQNAAGNFAGRIEQTTLNAHLRPNQQFSSIIQIGNQADSVYHSWQTTLRKRFSSGLLMNLSYTFGKTIDVQSGDPVGTSYGPTTSTASDSTNLRLDRGPADFDQRHVATVTWIYELPFGKGKPFMKSANRMVDAVLGGWSLQGFNSVMSGEPFSISSGAKTAQYGASSRAILTSSSLPDDSLRPGALGPVFFSSTAGFALAPAGSTGMGRNMFQGPMFWDMDGALSKSFHASERVKVTFRAEAFNALNHANFRKLGSTSVGSTSILSSNFGTACCQTQSTSTSTAIVSNGEAYRVVQFVLKATF